MADVSAGFWWANRGTQRLNYSLALFSSRQRRFDSHEGSFLRLRFSHELVLLAQLSKLFHVLAGASTTKASNFWLKPLATRRAHSERCMPGLAVVVKERVLTQIPCVIVCSSRSLYMLLHDNLRWRETSSNIMFTKVIRAILQSSSMLLLVRALKRFEMLILAAGNQLPITGQVCTHYILNCSLSID